jgi:hypothetical protein
MIYTIARAGAVVAGAASCYGSGSDQKMRLLADPAPQHSMIKERTLVMGKEFDQTLDPCQNMIPLL